MAAESGYSNQKKKGQSQFKTIQPLGSNKFGASVASKALYDKTAQDAIVVTPILGATGQAEFLNVFFAGHNAIVDDLLRITSGTFINFETEIVSIIDVDNFYIPAILDWSDISGENAIIMAWVTNKANSDGSQIVALAPTGIAFIQDAALTLVNEDTAVPANNIALPTSLFIHKDGVQVPISVDTGTPANTVGVPVILTGAAGPINITAGDLNVQLTDQGANYDATRIGDGTNLLGITANNEALVHDTDVLNSVNDLLGLLPSAIGQQVSADSLSVALSLEQETILSDISTTLTAVGGAVNNTSLSVGAPNTGFANIPANATYIAGTDGINLVPLSTDASGVLDVSIASFPLPSGAATEAKQDTGNSSLSSIDGKLQANGVVDAGNSSTTPLGISGVFTGAAFEITKYAAINVNVISDVASATNGVKVEFSPDGTNWDHSHQTTYSGGNGVGYIFNAEYKYARVVYTNNTVAQTSFRLQTIFKTTLTTSSLYTLSQTVNANMFAALNRSVISGETTGGGGGYVNVKVNPSGALTVEADVTGTVSVSNFPVTQPVSGSVSVSNFPATQNTLPQTDSGTITNTQATVGLTAVRATVAGTAPNVARKKLMIKPSKNNTGSIYFGSSTVTTANGMEVIGPDRLEFTLDASDYYLISDLAAQVCEIIEVV
jgi:hypothetical protein